MTPKPNLRGEFGERFKVGDEVGGVCIVEVLPDRLPAHSYGYSYRYKAECLRCNHLRQMFHHSIVDRIRHNREGCHVCSNEEFARDDEVLSYDYDKWIDPPWKVPSNVR